MIIWCDVFAIAQSFFDTRLYCIAKKLNCSGSTISKIMRGDQSPSFSKDVFFDKVFKLETDSDSESEYFLDCLKKKISKDFPTVKGDLKDCWDEKDYDAFVNNLLKRTFVGAPEENVLNDLIQKANSTPERMIDIFDESIEDYPICKFLECNPVNLSSPIYIEDALSFSCHIQYEAKNRKLPDEKEGTYKEIVEFAKSVEKYIRILTPKRLPHYLSPDEFQSIKEDTKRMEEAECFRQQLLSTYKYLCEKVSNKLIEEFEQQRKESLKQWDENALQGRWQ